tara:strand:+ start:217 stop:564 length:348 start_codon:yes stop_codon:yes gene_type:complete
MPEDNISPIVEMLNQYGFATVAAIAMGYFIYFIYTYITGNIIEKLDKAQYTTILLIDRIRMLDNDLIRLRSKLDTILAMRENEEKDGTRNNNKDSNMSLDRRRSSSNREDGNPKE